MKKLAFALFLLIGATEARAQNAPPCLPSPYRRSFAHETITVSTTSIGLTVATFAPGGGQLPAECAVATVETDNIRFWTDGSAPTSSAGLLLINSATSNNIITIGQRDLPNIRFIRAGAADVKLSIQYYAPVVN